MTTLTTSTVMSSSLLHSSSSSARALPQKLMAKEMNYFPDIVAKRFNRTRIISLSMLNFISMFIANWDTCDNFDHFVSYVIIIAA